MPDPPGKGSAIFRIGLKDILRQTIPAVEKYRKHHPKANIVVPVVRIVPVAMGTTNILMIIVVRPAAKNAVPRADPFAALKIIFFCRNFEPRAQQLPDFNFHCRHVLVLSGRKPSPAHCQP